MDKTFKTVALIGKYKSPEIAPPLLELAAYLEGRGVQVMIDRLTASHIGECRYPVMALEELGPKVDLAVVLGGDGTMLNIARTFAPFSASLVHAHQRHIERRERPRDVEHRAVAAEHDGQIGLVPELLQRKPRIAAIPDVAGGEPVDHDLDATRFQEGAELQQRLRDLRALVLADQRDALETRAHDPIKPYRRQRRGALLQGGVNGDLSFAFNTLGRD